MLVLKFRETEFECFQLSGPRRFAQEECYVHCNKLRTSYATKKVHIPWSRPRSRPSHLSSPPNDRPFLRSLACTFHVIVECVSDRG